MQQLSLFDAPAPIAPPVPSADIQSWLLAIGRTPEAAECGDPATIARDLAAVEDLIARGVDVDEAAFEDLCRYWHTARCDAREFAAQFLPAYEALAPRLLRAHQQIHAWGEFGQG